MTSSINWLEFFENEVTDRFPVGLEINYKFGRFNSVKFRIVEYLLTVSTKKELGYWTFWSGFIPIMRCNKKLKKNIYGNMQGIVDAFKEKEKEEKRMIEKINNLNLE